MNNLNDLVSVIIPVYNVQEYLEQSVESVINQTYKNLEIILIDDGSKDNSPRICDDLMHKDNRIKVIHQNNQGQSGARNEGLKHVHGQFVMFLDSDDYIHNETVERLLSVAIETNCDIVDCDFFRFDERTFELSYFKNKMPKHKSVLNGKKALGLMMRYMINCAAWGKLYKYDIVKDFRFPLDKFNEDLVFNSRVYLQDITVCEIKDALYYYRKNPNSLTHCFNRTHFDLVYNAFEIRDYMAQNCKALVLDAEAMIDIAHCNLFISMKKRNAKMEFPTEYHMIKSFIRKRYFRILFGRGYHLKERVKATIALLPG